MNTISFNKIDIICHSCGCNYTSNMLKADIALVSTYKLFYIFKGTCKVEVDGKLYTLGTDCSIMIFPYQHYQLISSEKLKFYWLEFSGVECAAMVSQTAFSITTPTVSELNVKGFEFLFEFPDCKSNNICDKYRNGSVIILILSYYLEHFPGKHKKQNSYISSAMIYIEENLQNADFGVKDIAEHLRIDRSHFYKLFKNETGISPVDFITKQRISQAEIMLTNNRFSIKDIAYSVGFSDPLYFSRVFKKYTGASPSEFRKRLL